MFRVGPIFLSPEPLGSLVSLKHRHAPLSFVRPPFSKIFFSKTAGPIEAKFHVESPWVEGTKVCSGHLGRWAAYMVKTLQKFSSLEPKGQ